MAFHGSLAASTLFTKQSCVTGFVNLMILGLSLFLAARLLFKCRVCYVFIGPKRNSLIKVSESHKTSHFYSSQNYRVVSSCRPLLGTLSQHEDSAPCPLLKLHQPPRDCPLERKCHQTEALTFAQVRLCLDQEKSHDCAQGGSTSSGLELH